MFESLKRLYRDETGAASAASLILLVTILGIGGIVGLVSFRNQVVQELGDTAAALTNLDQSFSYSIVVDNGDDPPETIASGMFPGEDQEQNPMISDNEGSPPGCIILGPPPEQ